MVYNHTMNLRDNKRISLEELARQKQPERYPDGAEVHLKEICLTGPHGGEDKIVRSRSASVTVPVGELPALPGETGRAVKNIRQSLYNNERI